MCPPNPLILNLVSYYVWSYTERRTTNDVQHKWKPLHVNTQSLPGLLCVHWGIIFSCWTYIILKKYILFVFFFSIEYHCLPLYYNLFLITWCNLYLFTLFWSRVRIIGPLAKTELTTPAHSLTNPLLKIWPNDQIWEFILEYFLVRLTVTSYKNSSSR